MGLDPKREKNLPYIDWKTSVLISLTKGAQTSEPATNNSVSKTVLKHNMRYWSSVLAECQCFHSVIHISSQLL